MDTPKTTTLGTPCSANWDETWIAYVDAVEAKLGRRICGARTRGGNCCFMETTHPNGRCRFHGGIKAYGGKEGNTHALRTGLYSFRLRPCSVKCPMWTKCPFAADDVMQLPERDRPACVYEQTEYDDAIAEVTALAAGEENDGPETIAARDSLTRAARPYAMARVMTLRASMALAEESLVNVKHVDGELPHSRVSGHAEVYLRLDRAHRAREQHITQTAATIARTRRERAEREAQTPENAIPCFAMQMMETIEEEERLAKENAEAEAKQNAAAPVNPEPIPQTEPEPESQGAPQPPPDSTSQTTEQPYNVAHPSPSSPFSPSGQYGPSGPSGQYSPSPTPQNRNHSKEPSPRQTRARPTRRHRTRKRSRPNNDSIPEEF